MSASPTTTGTAAELRQDLGTVAYEHMQSASERGHIGLRLMPVFRSGVSSAKFPKWGKKNFLKRTDDLRAAGGQYNEVGVSFDWQNFSTDDRGLKIPIDDRLQALYAAFTDVEEASTRAVIDSILMNHEARVAALAAAGGPDDEVNNEWDDAEAATPRADVKAAKMAFRAANGFLPNTLAMSLTVFENLLLTSEISEKLQYTNPIEMGGFEAQRAALAAYFGVGRIEVAGGMEDTADKGQATALAEMWDDEYCHLLYTSDGGNQIMRPCWGRTILWTPGSGGGSEGDGMLIVERYRDEDRRSEMVRARYDVDEFEQMASCKYTLGNITS
jgi:hypothetical protein